MLARAAREYARRGLHIFPLLARSKMPIGGSRGFLDAAPDPLVWTFAGDCNIGVSAIGSGLVIVDVDDPDAVEDLPGPLPHTWCVLTARGSQHHYRVRDGMAPIWPGIPGRVDVRWRGYGVLPPSVHPSGRVYMWEASSRIDEIPIADAPAWLVGRARPRRDYGHNGGSADASFLGEAFRSLDMLGHEVRPGVHAVRCPWADEHTTRGSASSTVIFAPGDRGLRIGTWHCSHGHCSGRRTEHVIDWLPKSALVAAAMAGYRRELESLA